MISRHFVLLYPFISHTVPIRSSFYWSSVHRSLLSNSTEFLTYNIISYKRLERMHTLQIGELCLITILLLQLLKCLLQ